MQHARFNIAPFQLTLGSSLFWAWVDTALFRPTLFINGETEHELFFLAFVATVCICAACLLISAAYSKHIDSFLRGPLATSSLSVGSVAGGMLIAFGSSSDSTALLLAGAAANGIVFGLGVLLWGKIYASHGARSASMYLPSSIAVAVLISLASSHLESLTALVFAIVLPIGSFTCEALGNRQRKDQAAAKYQYLSARVAKADAGEENRRGNSLIGTFRDGAPFGLTWNVICSFFLFGLAFGFLQNDAVLSRAVDVAQNADILLAARGATALMLLVASSLLPTHLHTIYRIGLMVMIAGFMIMPFSLLSPSLQPMALSVIPTIGYTCFDIMSWVVLCEISYCSRLAPEICVGFGRGLIHAGVGLGALVGGLSSAAMFNSLLSVIATTSVGYLLVIAVVLVIGDSHGLWSLLKYGSAYQTVAGSDSAGSDHRMALFCLHYSLSDREREVIALFSGGRSTKVIAEQLFISENTVKSHLRHAYSKIGVHNRQELIDALESMDFEGEITGQ